MLIDKYYSKSDVSLVEDENLIFSVKFFVSIIIKVYIVVILMTAQKILELNGGEKNIFSCA